MSRTLWSLSLLACLAGIRELAWAEDGPALKEALALQEVVQDAIAVAEPSVACIVVYHGSQERNLADPNYVPESFGSGVVIEQQGLILTNYHVVRDEPTQIYVRLPGGKGSYAKIHAADPRSDLAVLQLRDKLELKPIKFGDTSRVRKGQFVICLSNPYAVGASDGSPSASQGIISNIRRRAPGNPKQEKEEAEVPRGNQKKPLQRYTTLFQTDARLNLGCSGGALINLRGELIGLTTSLAALSGGETAGGFAVPMDAAIQRIVKVLKEGKQVEYGFLGVSLGAGAGRGDGVRLDDQFPVIRGSPAEKAGLKRGDTILKVNGMPVNYNDDLFLALGMLLAGSEARLEVRSALGGTRQVSATLAKYHVEGKIIASNLPADVRGIRVDYTSILAQTAPAFGPVMIRPGVYVKEVKPGSAADKVEIRVLDVITRVNGHSVSTPDEFYQRAKQPGPLELTLETNRTVKLN